MAHERVRARARHPILHLARPHEGIDVSAPMGMEIEARPPGNHHRGGLGRGVRQHADRRSRYGLKTRYAHCSKILVVRGQRVKRGQPIAKVGSTGLSTDHICTMKCG